MTLSESLASLKDIIIKNEQLLIEAKGHLDHPEDLVFLEGSKGAHRAIQAIVNTVKHPQQITIKFDGYPALIFGVGMDGKFIVVDKHMMNKSGGAGRHIYSPEQFISYDQARGITRSDLGKTISLLWPNLLKSYSGSGYYWGDLIFSKPLKPQSDGLYHFKENPNGIEYTVDPNSEIGKLMTGKLAGVAVHQYMDPDAPEKAEKMSTPNRKVVPTDLAKPLNGKLGGLKNNSDIALVPAKMPITPKLTLNNELVNKANQSANAYGHEIDAFISNSPSGGKTLPIIGLFTEYINFRIRQRNLSNLTGGFYKFVEQKASAKKISGVTARGLLGYTDPETKKPVPGYLKQNAEALKHIFQIWIDVYKLKMSVVPQLDKAAAAGPIQGYLQDGSKSQEGFVSHGLKLVNRFGFSAQNLAGR